MAPKKSSRTGVYYYAQECRENGSIKARSIGEAIGVAIPM